MYLQFLCQPPLIIPALEERERHFNPVVCLMAKKKALLQQSQRERQNLKRARY